MKRRIITLALSLAVVFCIACGCISNDGSKNLSTYTIDAAYDPVEQVVTAHQKLEYVNNTETALKTLELHLYANAYRQGAQYTPVKASQIATAYPNGSSYGHIEISNVTVGGVPQETVIAGNDSDILVITFNSDLYPDNRVVVEMDFMLKLAEVSHRLGFLDNVANLGNWYPVASVYSNGSYYSNPYYSNGDPFFSDIANYDVNITVPKDYTVAATGEKTSSTESGASVKQSYSIKKARDFAMVISNGFQTKTGKYKDTSVTYFYQHDANPDTSLNTAIKSLEVFSEMFGEYPFGTMSVVETNFLHGGMEYPTLVYISKNVEGDLYQEVIVHEIAHQWWYGIVGSNPVANAWMDEGLTEYATTLYFEKINGAQSRTDRVGLSLRNYLIYVDVYKSLKGEIDTSMNRASNMFSTEYEYTNMTYVKGELMFDNLRLTVGDTAFFNGLKKYYDAYAYKIAAPEDMIACFQKASKLPLDGFFSAWLEGKNIIGNSNP